MIETPAAVLIADELAAECDFFSIGTNDLTQYTCALDRQNAKLEPFFNPHHPAVLRAIKMTIEAATATASGWASAVSWVPTPPSPRPSCAWAWTSCP